MSKGQNNLEIKFRCVAFCCILVTRAARAIPPCPGFVSPSNSCELVSGVTGDRGSGHYTALMGLGPGVSSMRCYVSVMARSSAAVIMLLSVSEDFGTPSCHIGGIICGGWGTLALSREQWQNCVNCQHVMFPYL